MLLLKQGKIVQVDTSESGLSNDPIIAIRTLEEYNKQHPQKHYRVGDEEYTLGYSKYPDGGKIHLFKMSKSPYFDNSGIGDGFGFNGAHESKGEAIARMQQEGFKVYQGGVEILPLNH